MKKPLFPVVVANYFLLTAFTQFLAVYMGFRAGTISMSGPIPQSPLSAGAQWLWIAVGAVSYTALAIAIQFDRPWVKPAIISVIVLNTLVGLFLNKASPLVASLAVGHAALEVAAILFIRNQGATERSRLRDGGNQFRRAMGLFVYWGCAALMLSDLMAVFAGAANPIGNQKATAGSLILLALMLLLVGGAILGRSAWAAWQAGTMLVSLSAFYAVYCVWTFLYIEVIYPQHPWNFHWDASFIWLAILGTIGFWLLAASERRQAI